MNHNFPGPQLARIWGTPNFQPIFTAPVVNGSPEKYAGLVPQRSTIGFQVNHLCRVVSCDFRCVFRCVVEPMEPTVDTKTIGSRWDMLEESEQSIAYLYIFILHIYMYIFL